MPKQLLIHQLAFLKHNFESLGEFQFHFILDVPMDLIGVDIETGMSNLSQHAKERFNQLVYREYDQFFEDIKHKSLAPLIQLHRFSERVKTNVFPVLVEELNIDVLSLSISSFADVYENSDFHVDINP